MPGFYTAKIIPIISFLCLQLACGKAQERLKILSDGLVLDQPQASPTPPIRIDVCEGGDSNFRIPAIQEEFGPYKSCDEFTDDLMSYAAVAQSFYVQQFIAKIDYQTRIKNVDQPDEEMICQVSKPPENFVGDNETAPVDKTKYEQSNGSFIYLAHQNTLSVTDFDGRVVHRITYANEEFKGLHLEGSKLLLITETAEQKLPNFGLRSIAVHPSEVLRDRFTYADRKVVVREFTTTLAGQLGEPLAKSYAGSFKGGSKVGGTLLLVLARSLQWDVLATGLDIFSSADLAYGESFQTKDKLVVYAIKAAEANLAYIRRAISNNGGIFKEYRSRLESGTCANIARLTSLTNYRVKARDLTPILLGGGIAGLGRKALKRQIYTLQIILFFHRLTSLAKS